MTVSIVSWKSIMKAAVITKSGKMSMRMNWKEGFLAICSIWGARGWVFLIDNAYGDNCYSTTDPWFLVLHKSCYQSLRSHS
jgi:hypothetical protein